MPGESIDVDVAHALDGLKAAGIGQAILLDLTRPDVRVPVVRMVVPGLEGWTDKVEAAIPGRRRLSRAGARREGRRRVPRPDALAPRGAIDARRRLPPAGRPWRRPPGGAAPAAGHRDRRRGIRAGARRVAQGDPLRPLRGSPRLRRGEHGRVAGGRARRVRDARHRRCVPRIRRRSTRGRRRGCGRARRRGARLPGDVGRDGRRPRDDRSGRRRGSRRPARRCHDHRAPQGVVLRRPSARRLARPRRPRPRAAA